MILTKQKIDRIDIDFLINDKLSKNKISEVLFIVPTKRKIRYLTRELISLSPGKSLSGLKIETIGSFAEKLLTEIEGRVNLISEEAAVLLLNHSFNRVKLKYFSQYKNQIPFGTLERVKNVISEYKRHGITPERLKEEAENLSGSEKLKAFDIADVYDDYQKTLIGNNFRETGDIYSSLNRKEKKLFNEAFNFIYPDAQFVLVNGFDEFTTPEVEIINSASEIIGVELFVAFDYYKYNPAVFSHLNSCHDRLEAKGFKEVKDISPSTQSKFLNIIREKLSLKSQEKKETSFQDFITQIDSSSREVEIELIAKQIKKLLLNDKVEPEKICIVFNLIGNYSAIIRDRFNVYGIPFNLTDRFSLSTSPPVKTLLGLLEILENDFYFKNIFRAFSGGFLGKMGIDISNLLKTSVELKIVSGYDNWLNKLKAKISELSSPDEHSNHNQQNIQLYETAITDLKKINSHLKPFSQKLTPDEFRENILSLVYKLEFPANLLKAPSEVVENDAIAFNTFINVIDEVTNLIKLEYGSEEKFPLHFYLNQLRTTAAFTRYNIPEKPGYGVQITTLNEIRGLSFDYLFIGGLNDGDLPTRFTPEIFFSGSFAREEVQHQVEQRYLFYQALCTWKKKLYLSYPQTDGKRDLVQSSFLQDFNLLFDTKKINKDDFKDEIYSKEELLELLGRLSSEQRKELKFSEEINIDIEGINRAIEIDKKRMEEPFGESEFTGFVSKDISDELKNKLSEISEGEFSATQLENYAKCPYKYFVENVLRLETIAEPVEELEAFEYGSLIHSILYEFYTNLPAGQAGLKEKGIVLSNCSDEDFKSAEILLFKIAERRFDELNLNPEFSFYEREKLLGINGKRTQSLLYKFLEEERKSNDGYVPEFFELSFGKVKHDEKFSNKFKEGVNAGGVKLKGKIDRIDINEAEKTLKVIDYKLGGTKPTAEELATGISLQLPLYLFAAKELIKKELGGEYRPAGAQIFSLKFNEKDFGKKSISLKARKSKTENIEEEIVAAEEMIKICLEMVAKFTTEISQGKFHLSTLKNRETKVCRFCDFKKICRIQEVE
ncbi:MAG: PD-(D/E)XK nuclease family protein [Ignavibacteriaceae bacterium]|nr:PD-(D/E)XK nuclease family protein [Ignavibacteriaceae bacterium]